MRGEGDWGYHGASFILVKRDDDRGRGSDRLVPGVFVFGAGCFS